MKTGDAITIDLPSTPAGGYEWTLDDPNASGVAVAPPVFRPAGDGVGGGGVQSWTVHVHATGRVPLSFRYWRPWAGDSSVIDRFTVTLAVS